MLQIPFDEPIPVLGNLHKTLIRGIREYDDELLRKHGKTVGFFQGPYPVVLTSDLKFIKAVLIKDFSSFTNRRVSFFFYMFSHLFLQKLTF